MALFQRSKVVRHCLHVLLGIREHLKHHRSICLSCQQRDDTYLHLVHVLGRYVSNVVLCTYALCCCLMMSRHKRVCYWTLVQPLKLSEYTSAVIVKQNNAQIASDTAVPQSILIVEEAEIAYNLWV